MVINNLLNKFIVDSKELLNRIQSEKIKIIDARWYLSDKGRGFIEYKKNHIEGAIFFDIDQLSNKSIDLPHMFPTKEQFKKFAEEFGIERTNEIVVYDQEGFFSSSRVWLIFKYFGFRNIKILNGGMKNWIKKKFPTTKTIKKHKKSKFYCNNILTNTIINKKQLEKILENKENYRIIDARPKKRFLGIVKEPRPNLKKGNIKNSFNIPFDLISENGNLKNLEKLEIIFKKKNNLKFRNNIICYCGSGITACNIIFTLNILGYKKVQLYDGSWAEWGKKK